MTITELKTRHAQAKIEKNETLIAALEEAIRQAEEGEALPGADSSHEENASSPQGKPVSEAESKERLASAEKAANEKDRSIKARPGH